MSLFALIMLALGWAGWGIIKNLYPTETFTWYPTIPGLFFIMGMLMIFILARNYKKEARKLINIYMIMKLVKFVIAIAFVLIFYFIVKTNFRIFGLMFAAFYAIYIVMETYIFYSVEKKIKKEQ
jgi:hypothetical protein